MPPAATNGIMYETPVIRYCRTLVPTLAFRTAPWWTGPATAAADGGRLVPDARCLGDALSDGGDRGGDHAGAVVHGLLDADVDERLAGEPLLVPDLEVGGVDDAVGRGDDRADRAGSEPAEPWVSTWTSWPAALPDCSRFSAAM